MDSEENRAKLVLFEVMSSIYVDDIVYLEGIYIFCCLYI